MKNIAVFKWILLMGIIQFFSNCQKEREPESPVTPLEQIKIDSIPSWQTPFYPHSSGGISFIPVIYENTVIFNVLYNPNQPYYLLDKVTGKINGLITNPLAFANTDIKPQLYNSYLISQYSEKTHIVDLEKKTIQRVFDPSAYGCYNLSLSNTLNNNKIINSYYKLFLDPNVDDKTLISCNYLLSFNIENQQIDTLLKINDTSSYSTKLIPPTIYVNTQGDTVLLFKKHYSWLGGSFSAPNSITEKTDLYAYNLSQKKAQWINYEVSTNDDNLTINKTLLLSGRTLIFQGTNKLIAFDAETGKEKWSKDYTVDFDEITVAENVLVVSLNFPARNVVAFDIETGNLKWDYSTARAVCRNIAYHNGYIYFESIYSTEKKINSNNMIKRVRLEDGKLDWIFYIPDSKTAFQGMTIDKNTNFLYTNDDAFMYGIKLPD